MIARGLLLALLLEACAASTSQKGAASLEAGTLETITLRDDAAHALPLKEAIGRDRFTVLLFFAEDCPVLKAHDARVRELAQRYGATGVGFVAVVSEVDADLAKERAAAKQRGWSMPVLEDHGAVLANALGVEYSTHAVLLDREGRVFYSGALDSDRVHMTDGASPWLRDAIDSAVAGRPITRARTEALGCPLRKR